MKFKIGDKVSWWNESKYVGRIVRIRVSSYNARRMLVTVEWQHKQGAYEYADYAIVHCIDPVDILKEMIYEA